MTLLTTLKIVLAAEAAWGGVLLVLLISAMASRRASLRRTTAKPTIQANALDALTAYLGGNNDLGQLKALFDTHREELEETLLQLQSVVGGRRNELCELAIRLGYAQGWCEAARSKDIADRRRAYACLSAVAHHEPIHRLIGSMAQEAFRDPDEQIRLEAARTLLRGGDPAQIDRVFEGVLQEPPRIRLLLANELARHAVRLCTECVPSAFRSAHPRHLVNLLELLASWERILPLGDVSVLAGHPVAAVRVAVMRLLPLLPNTTQNGMVLRTGLADREPEVRAAAAAAANRLCGTDSMGGLVPALGAQC